MVLYERKQLQAAGPEFTPTNPDHPVYVIPETLEYFVSYDKYLERLDFYSRKKFNCEFSGAANLTYFDARRQETIESRHVLSRFPEALKRPVLTFVQSSRTVRLDVLTDEIYGFLKSRYFPGEIVIVKRPGIKQSVKILYADDEGKYSVQDLYGGNSFWAETADLTRSRSILSKPTIRAFIKQAAYRERNAKSPWLVKESYAKQFGLEAEPPIEIKPRESPAPSSLPGSFSVKIEEFEDDDLFMLAKSAGSQKLVDYVSTLRGRYPWPEWHVDERLEGLSAVQKVGNLFEAWLFTQLYRRLLELEPQYVLNFDKFLDGLRAPKMSAEVVELHKKLLCLLVEEDGDSLAMPLPVEAEEESAGVKEEKAAAAADGADDSADGADGADSAEEEAEEEAKEASRTKKASRKTQSKPEASKNADDEAGSEESDNSDVSSEPDSSWIARIGRRELDDWPELVVELLASVPLREWQADTKACLDVLRPSDEPHTPVSAANGYEQLPLASRVHVLTVILSLAYQAPVFRSYLDKMFEEQSKLRRKPLLKDLRQLKDDLKVSERALSSATEPKERAEITEHLESVCKAMDQKKLEYEQTLKEIARVDSQRVQLLGTDRFFNRYWYMEGAGVASLENGDTYAVGRLCVQGPSAEDLQSYLDSELYTAEFSAYRQRVFESCQQVKLEHNQYLREMRSRKRPNTGPKSTPTRKVSLRSSDSDVEIISVTHRSKPAASQPATLGTPQPANAQPGQPATPKRAVPQAVTPQSSTPRSTGQPQEVHPAQPQVSTQAAAVPLPVQPQSQAHVPPPVQPQIAAPAPAPAAQMVQAPAPAPAAVPGSQQVMVLPQAAPQTAPQTAPLQAVLPAPSAKSTSKSNDVEMTNQRLYLRQRMDLEERCQRNLRAQGSRHRIELEVLSRQNESQEAFEELRRSQAKERDDLIEASKRQMEEFLREQQAQQTQMQTQQAQLQAQQQAQLQAQQQAQLQAQQAQLQAQQQAQLEAHQAHLQQAQLAGVPPAQYPYQYAAPGFSWVVQQTAYGPMLFAVPTQQYQVPCQYQQTPYGYVQAPYGFPQQAPQQLPLPAHPHVPQPHLQPQSQQIQMAPQPVAPHLMQPQPVPPPPQQPQQAQQSLPPPPPLNLQVQAQELQAHMQQVHSEQKQEQQLRHAQKAQTQDAELGMQHDNDAHKAQSEQKTEKFKKATLKVREIAGKLIKAEKDSHGAKPAPDLQPAPESVLASLEQPAAKEKAHESTASKRDARAVEPTPKEEILDQEDPMTPLKLMELFEHNYFILSPSQWRFYDTPDEVDALARYLTPAGARERRLLSGLHVAEERLKRSMQLRLAALKLDEKPSEQAE